MILFTIMFSINIHAIANFLFTDGESVKITWLCNPNGNWKLKTLILFVFHRKQTNSRFCKHFESFEKTFYLFVFSKVLNFSLKVYLKLFQFLICLFIFSEIAWRLFRDIKESCNLRWKCFVWQNLDKIHPSCSRIQLNFGLIRLN